MAKFKPGDKVKIVGEPQSKIFVVEDVIGDGVNAAYFVKGRPDVGYQESYLTLANSRACNANFKAGEPVWWTQNGTRVDGRVVGSLGGGKYEVKKNIGGTWEVDGADLHHVFDNYPANSRACSAVRSTNAVVRKALNACARNGGIDDFKVGDRVMVRSVVGFTPTDPKPGTVTAIYKSDNRIAVKKDDGGRGLFDASMVTKNACGAARNATENDVKQALAEIKGLTQHVTAIKSKIRALGNKVREITHFQSGLDYKVSSQVSDAYDKLMSDLWEAANAG